MGKYTMAPIFHKEGVLIVIPFSQWKLLVKGILNLKRPFNSKHEEEEEK